MRIYLSLIKRNRNYRYLWFGSVISQLGDWFNLLASAELISELSGSGAAISFLFLSRFLPLFVFSPIAGVLADRYNRRMILIVSDVLRGLTVLGFLLIRSPEQVWVLYLLTVTQFALGALFTPARTAVLASVVVQRDLVTANALDSFTWSSMLALGAFLGGVVAAIFGTDAAFIADAATFFLSAWVIGRIQMPTQGRAMAVQRTGFLDFVDGLRYVRGDFLILTISLIKAAGSLVWGAVNVLEVSFADHVFPLAQDGIVQALRIEDGGTATLGIIYMVSGIGTGLGPLVLRRWFGDSRPRLLQAITLGFVLMAVGILGLGLAPTLPLFLAATLVRTVGTGSLWVFSAVYLQMLAPDRFRGRVFAFEFAMLTLTQSLSILAAGFMQDGLQWRVQQVAVTMGGLGVVTTLLWGLLYLTWLRRYAGLKTAVARD